MGSEVEVVAGSGTLSVDQSVLAAGPWTSTLLPGWHLPREVERRS